MWEESGHPSLIASILLSLLFLALPAGEGWVSGFFAIENATVWKLMGSKLMGSESSARVLWHLTLTPYFFLVLQKAIFII
jgi:hypothetical protein